MLWDQDIKMRLNLAGEESSRFDAFIKEQDTVRIKKTLRGIQIDDRDADRLIEAWNASEAERDANIRAQEAADNAIRRIPVTTADIQTPYDVIGPLFFQTSNKGVFGSSFKTLWKQYLDELRERRAEGLFSPQHADWGYFAGVGMSVGQNDFDDAFYIAVEEMKKKAAIIGADAIVGMRMDFDLDTNGYQYFYLQMYGTAVKYK